MLFPFAQNNLFVTQLGTHKLGMSSPYEQSYQIHHSNIVVHRRYGEIAEHANDIAMFKIENADGSGAKLNEHVHPICLPDHVNWELQVMEPNYGECLISGFGSINGIYFFKVEHKNLWYDIDRGQ